MTEEHDVRAVVEWARENPIDFIQALIRLEEERAKRGEPAFGTRVEACVTACLGLLRTRYPESFRATVSGPMTNRRKDNQVKP